MSELVADCPRCGSQKITFNLISQTLIAQNYGWQGFYEAFCVCRHCRRSTVFFLSAKGAKESAYIEKTGLEKVSSTVNSLVNIESHITLKDEHSIEPPDYLPETILPIFQEGATCLAVNCYNAAGTMFRLCVDLATKSLLPPVAEEHDGLNSKVRRDLGLRLPWLFKNKYLPEALEALSSCIKEDGNDGAHAGSLKKVDAEDLQDFTFALLERLYTESERIRLANLRRDERRKPPA